MSNANFIGTRHFAAAKLSILPLNVRPVRLRDSLYLLIPVDIARLIGIASNSDFSLSLAENQETVRLVYELKKASSQEVEGQGQ